MKKVLIKQVLMNKPLRFLSKISLQRMLLNLKPKASNRNFSL